MLKSLFHSVISSVMTRVDDQLKTVTELKKSLEFTQKNVENLDTVATKLEDAKGEIGSHQKNLDEQSSKMEYLENQSRRNNSSLEFQEKRNLLMKRGRLLKRKSRKQSWRSLI